MFEIEPNRAVKISLPFIVDNYKEFHYDEIPMLYSGTNLFGNIIIGSLICEDDDGDIFRYIHSLPQNIDYKKFIKNKISYRELLEKQERLYVVDKNYDEQPVSVYEIMFNEIPVNYLPHPEFFCPNVEKVIGTEISFNLQGSLANIHEALTRPVSVLSNGFNNFIDLGLSNLNFNNVSVSKTMTAFQPNSFDIGYRIKFNSRTNDLYFPKYEKTLNNFIAHFVDYSINHLPAEVAQLKNKEIEGTKYQEQIETNLKLVYASMTHVFTESAVDKIINSLLKVPIELEKIANEVGHGFDYIDVMSIYRANDYELGIMDSDFSDEVHRAVEYLESINDRVSNDADFLVYSIYVYHLNIKSRKGQATYSNQSGNEIIIDSPRIQITGEKDLQGSEFIQSMDTGRIISVRAKGRWVNGRLKSLSIDY